MVEPRTEEAARAGGGAVVEVAVGAAHAHPRGLLVLLVWRQLDHDGVFDEVKVLRVLMRGEDAARNPSACETRVEARVQARARVRAGARTRRRTSARAPKREGTV